MQQQIDDYSKIWDDAEKVKRYAHIDTEKDWRQVKTKAGFYQRSKKIPLRTYLLRISAILVLALGLAWFLNQVVNQVDDQTNADYFTVSSGDQSLNYTMPDGSVVVLNKHTDLFYNSGFGKENRDIILDGEAFFDVERNENLAFKVFAGNSTIEVLGTSFNINYTRDKVQLGVVSGQVAFFETANKSHRIDLTKDEMTEYMPPLNQFSEKQSLNPNLMAWRTKRLIFKNVPLNEVFTQVAGYYGYDLELKSDKGIQESITATFEDQTLKEVLEYIQLGTKQEITTIITDNQLIVRF